MENEPEKTENKLKDFRHNALAYLEKIGLFVLELVKVVVLAGVTIALVRYFLFKPFYVKGASMEPNFFDKEYLIIDELTYRLRRGKSDDLQYRPSRRHYFR